MKPPTDGSAVDFLLLMEDYQGSYTDAYRTEPSLHGLPYRACAERLFSRAIYYGDAYADALTSHGLAAEQVVPRCRPLQFKWANERNIWNPSEWVMRVPWATYPAQLAKHYTDRWVLSRILAKQVTFFRPDILWLFSGIPVTIREVRNWRRHAEHVILWWSCPLKDRFPYREFDLILTAIPHLLSHFKNQGIDVAYLPHSFDPRILKRVPCLKERVPRVAFAGSFSRGHTERIRFMDVLSRRVPVDFYGHGERFLPPGSPLRGSYRGPAWGEDLYSVYGSYLIVVHKNIDVAQSSASAKRLFEATGMGACVVAEKSDDLASFFEPDVEIATYSDVEECIEKVNHLLKNPDEARRIGRRGQERTLKEHTYSHRVRELLLHLEVSQVLERA